MTDNLAELSKQSLHCTHTKKTNSVMISLLEAMPLKMFSNSLLRCSTSILWAVKMTSFLTCLKMTQRQATSYTRSNMIQKTGMSEWKIYCLAKPGQLAGKSAGLVIKRLPVQISAEAAGQFSSPVSTLSADLIQCLFHPCVTTVARKRPQSFCQKWKWQVIPKHAYIHDPTKSEWAD